MYCDLLAKSWLPYYKHALILATLQYSTTEVMLIHKLFCLHLSQRLKHLSSLESVQDLNFRLRLFKLMYNYRLSHGKLSFQTYARIRICDFFNNLVVGYYKQRVQIKRLQGFTISRSIIYNKYLQYIFDHWKLETILLCTL